MCGRLYLLICVTAVEVCDARDDDSTTAAGRIIFVSMSHNLLRPDFIGISLRFTRNDDSTTAVG